MNYYRMLMMQELAISISFSTVDNTELNIFFDDSWKPLQGPALCVFNDTCFSENDLVGIQNLREGSKSDDPTKTGKFSVGFNSVYHLTDVPSFLSKGPQTPNGGTFCVFDPHCKYVPNAEQDYPGIQIQDLDIFEESFIDVYNTAQGVVLQRRDLL